MNISKARNTILAGTCEAGATNNFGLFGLSEAPVFACFFSAAFRPTHSSAILVHITAHM